MNVEEETRQEEPAVAPETQPEERERPVQKRKKSKKFEIKAEELEVKELGEKDEKPALAPKGVTAAKEKWFEQEGQLAVDFYETPGELVVQSTVAGVKPEDLDISIEADRVLIKGQRAEQTEEGGKNYFYQECYWGRFSREIILPSETDPGRAQASIKNGVLIVRIPKIERDKKRKIEVKS